MFAHNWGVFLTTVPRCFFLRSDILAWLFRLLNHARLAKCFFADREPSKNQCCEGRLSPRDLKIWSKTHRKWQYCTKKESFCSFFFCFLEPKTAGITYITYTAKRQSSLRILLRYKLLFLTTATIGIISVKYMLNENLYIQWTREKKKYGAAVCVSLHMWCHTCFPWISENWEVWKWGKMDKNILVIWVPLGEQRQQKVIQKAWPKENSLCVKNRPERGITTTEKQGRPCLAGAPTKGLKDV